ncbi:MAG: anaerobic ribonucleoside-triphosphate reductase activating protein [Candidatus Bipolaricaulis anaerobius]|nr:anaerobic ribonucleoside-triphosphate reductase activating protein [Candidatus Bipolaricaulis anaerobius]
MEIAHLQPLSLLDYPGKVSAVVWTVGCNLRCPFCYNAELVLPGLAHGLPRLPLEEVVAALTERARFLDGLVVTGGEPALHRDLPLLLREVKELGLRVKLDTNGTRPAVLRSLLEDGLVDYVALDVKAPFARYPEFTGLLPLPHVASEPVPDVVTLVRESVALVRERAPDYEFRTTVAPGLAPDDLFSIAHGIRGARRYVLQPFFVPDGKRLVDEEWRGRPALSSDTLRALLPELQKIVSTELRG